jgi:hypothetical protein
MGLLLDFAIKLPVDFLPLKNFSDKSPAKARHWSSTPKIWQITRLDQKQRLIFLIVY